MDQCGAQVVFSQAAFTYRDGAERLDACRDLTFTIQPGDSIALIGPSGCGKSTTLHMIAGLISPSGGEVLVNGAPVSCPRRETAFIPQDLGLFPWKTVLQNAMLGLQFHKVAKAQAVQRAREALEQVGLAGFEQAFPKALSGGMRQRLALARALAMDADLLLMDEPLSAIDALLRESLQDTLRDLWAQRHHTQILVTHSIEEAVFLGRRILVFSDRPGTVIDEIANERAGRSDWRDSAEFAEKCREVRAALSQSSVRDAADARAVGQSSVRSDVDAQAVT